MMQALTWALGQRDGQANDPRATQRGDDAGAAAQESARKSPRRSPPKSAAPLMPPRTLFKALSHVRESHRQPILGRLPGAACVPTTHV